MKSIAQFQIHVGRFARWHRFLMAFDALVAASVAWNIWQWGDAPDAPMMRGLSVGMFFLVLAAQQPYWKIRPFTLRHDARGWSLHQDGRRQDLADVRAVVLPGLLLVLGLGAGGRVVLPVASDIAPAAWQELRTRLTL